MSVLFGITFIALMGMIYWNFRTPERWAYPIHLVFQSADKQALPSFNDDENKLITALNAVPKDPKDPKQRMYNMKYDKVPFPELSPREKWGSNSEDTDYGNNDGTKLNSHVTQQVSFKSMADLNTFLKNISATSAAATSPSPAPQP